MVRAGQRGGRRPRGVSIRAGASLKVSAIWVGASGAQGGGGRQGSGVSRQQGMPVRKGRKGGKRPHLSRVDTGTETVAITGWGVGEGAGKKGEAGVGSV